MRNYGNKRVLSFDTGKINASDKIIFENKKK